MMELLQPPLALSPLALARAGSDQRAGDRAESQSEFFSPARWPYPGVERPGV